MEFIQRLYVSMDSVFFWISWLVIPFVVEVIPKIYVFFHVLFGHVHQAPRKSLQQYPFITLIIPTYNSAATLKRCIQSVVDSTYPLSQIQVIIADNQSTDTIKDVYQQIQLANPELLLQYMNSKKGKASGMNAAIYQSVGCYIINMDADGVLDKKALEFIVAYLEEHPETPAVGGTIMAQTLPGKKSRFLQKNEFFEYCQIFLFGRQYASSKKEIFTLAGAFSAYRKAALFKTKLYNTDSIAEDTDMTFQIRTQISEEIAYCQEAVYYTDAIPNLQALISQRERWQKGELEVVSNFAQERLNFKNFFTNFVIRQMIVANTFAFLKMIWLFSSVMFLMMNFSGWVLAMSYVFLYLIYVCLALLYWLGILLILPKHSASRKRHLRNPLVIFTFPIYNFLTFWIRLGGIINYFTRVAKWNTTVVTDWQDIQRVIKTDWQTLIKGKKK
ncbi:TIGR03111 family XrtG-associated glycosyltransferase [Enterococcus asini]|uniref:TIGR03111 family XrtG-associated glycosyltransferase n=1 Tax=Enterococcus asini TaxID=57732 RepID=UPI0032E45541